MADDYTGSGSLRLTGPSHQMYDTTVGEQSVLRSITPENLGALYGVLLNQRASGDAMRGMYDRQLTRVNNQQAQLAAAKLSADDLKNVRSTGMDMVRYGGASMASLPALAALSSDPAALRAADLQAYGARDASAFADRAKGLAAAAEAGVTVNPGQSVNGMTAGGLAALRSTTTEPVALAKERIQAGATIGAARLNAAGQNRDRVVVKSYPGMPMLDEASFTSTTPEGAARLQAGYNATRPTGPAAGNGGGGPSTPGGPITDQATARARATAVGLPANLPLSNQGGRWSVIMPDGTRKPIP